MPSEKPFELSTEAFAALSLTEIIRLQELLSRELKRRFERECALVFSDVVGSTDRFARLGDEAGRRLQQRHLDLLGRVLERAGRVVDTAGDGAFLVFPGAEAAALALIELQQAIAEDNLMTGREQQLSVRIGLHFGPVLMDEALVTGDAVNLAARVAASAEPGEIRLTKQALLELPSPLRLRARPLGAAELAGVPRPVPVFSLEWRDRSAVPDAVRIAETGQEIELPDQDTIRFGRLKESDGLPANDVLLLLPDETAARKISRWHFELRRHRDALLLRPVSDQPTELDGAVIPKGAEVAVAAGSVIRVGRVMTLELVCRGAPSAPEAGDATLGAK